MSKTNYSGPFGTKDVLSPKGSEGSETDRFYIMALEDINPGTNYNWYAAASSRLDKIVDRSKNDFGDGKENTKYVMNKWNLGTARGGWGEHDVHDMWGAIENQVNKGWFVPSKSEWAAFAGEMGITNSNYKSYGLTAGYWSSSQNSIGAAYVMYFIYQGGNIIPSRLDVSYGVRLSTTF